MSEHGMMTFRKEERLCSRALTGKLFHREGSRSMAAFPLRLVYMKTDTGESDAWPKVLISVPKRCFKRAVKRNRVKRQVREAYRRNKQQLIECLRADGGSGRAVADSWLSDQLWDRAEVERNVCKLLRRFTEKMSV